MLEQPVNAHDWVKLDLVRYTPSSLKPADSSLQGPTAAAAASVRGSWQVQHVEELLPAFPRGDLDLKEALAALGLTRSSINRCGGWEAGIAARLCGWGLLRCLAAACTIPAEN
jgi:hypothetical protein